MFSKEMKKAVEEVQQCIMTCNQTSNISMVVTGYIDKYVKYLEELDPSDIAFEKHGFFNDMKIKRYWQRVADYYASIENLCTLFEDSRRILLNTINTLNNKQRKFDDVYTQFKGLVDSDIKLGSDNEYMQQAIVAENTSVLLAMTISEYKTLDTKVNNILSISKQVFDIALLIAQNTYKISVNSQKKSVGVAGVADIAIYQSRFADLRRMLM